MDNLFLGNRCSSDINNLKETGITKVLSIIEDFAKPKYKDTDNIKHKIVSIGDSESRNIIKYFGECINFIKGEEKVLVYCAGGISRSATVVIAYVMWNKKIPFLKALEFVLEKRLVSPNPGFRDQLELFEKELIKNEYDINKIKFDEIDWKSKNYYNQ